MTALPIPVHAAAHPSWRAHLQLRFSARAGCTLLSERQHVGPLLVQRPFYPEAPQSEGSLTASQPCHVYLIHPPGGVVAGDQLQLQAVLDEHAHAVITTPAATKFYRAAPNRVARVEQQLRVQNAILEWLPQESIYFNATAVRMRTRIDLDRGSRFIGWEQSCYGRLASDESFAEGHVRQSMELWCEGKPLFMDHLHVQGGSVMQQASWGLRQMTALGTLLAYPATADMVTAVRECDVDAIALSCTLVDGVLVCRCVHQDAAVIKRLLLRVWQCLRPLLLQREAVLPRIWAT